MKDIKKIGEKLAKKILRAALEMAEQDGIEYIDDEVADTENENEEIIEATYEALEKIVKRIKKEILKR